MSGKFIVIEGPDGSGKTAQVKRLVEKLEKAGADVLATHEPTDNRIGSLIREILRAKRNDELGRGYNWKTLTMLFYADRMAHLETVIEPALAADRIVVSDRYDLSTLIYQSVELFREWVSTEPGPARKEAHRAYDEAVVWLNQLADAVRRPDVTVVLAVDPHTVIERLAARGIPLERFEDGALVEYITELYAVPNSLLPDDRIRVLNGEGDEEAIAREVWTAVVEGLPV